MPAGTLPRNGRVRSVVAEPRNRRSAGLNDFIINFANTADGIPVWGTQPKSRDKVLREFWPTEPILASAVYSTCSRYAAFGWRLVGPPRTRNIVRSILHNCEDGAGWMPMILKVLQDLFTQDNGAFIEIIRMDDDYRSPVVSMRHLDAGRCYRTGISEAPVIYEDIERKQHELKYYQVIPLAEFPSPVETAYGAQYCAVTRMLKAAQIMRDIATYKREKISGKFVRAIHLVGGVSGKSVSEAMEAHMAQQGGEGFTTYFAPLVIAALDPTSTVSTATIDIASLPDNFNEETAMRWYINQLALAFGADYQDFAPLPGGNLGTAQQSEILHMKSRGKGPALFMRMLEHRFNFHGIMPETITFAFGEQDVAEDLQIQQLKNLRAQEREIRIRSLEIDPVIARQMALDAGDLEEAYLTHWGEENLTHIGSAPDSSK